MLVTVAPFGNKTSCGRQRRCYQTHGEIVAVAVIVAVTVGVNVMVGVKVGVSVGVLVEVAVLVGVAVGVGTNQVILLARMAWPEQAVSSLPMAIAQ